MIDFKQALTRINSIVPGSLQDIAMSTGASLAETFISADCVVFCDVSSSMHSTDAQGGKSRYDALLDELKTLQSNMPGKIAVIAFSYGTPQFCPNGTPTFMGGGTDVAGALKFGKVADIPNAMQFVVISDGQMDDEEGAVRIAKTYRNKINVIYVGSELSPSGRDSLQRLAQASGGQSITADRTAGLAKSTQKLLMAA